MHWPVLQTADCWHCQWSFILFTFLPHPGLADPHILFALFGSTRLLSKGFTWTEMLKTLSVSGIIKVFHLISLFFRLHALLSTPPPWSSWSTLLPAALSLLEPHWSQLTWKSCITAQWDHQEHAEVDSERTLGCSLLPFSHFPLSDRLPFMVILYLFPLFKGPLSKLHQSILYFAICWQIQTTPLDYWETVYWRKQATMLVRCYQVKNMLWQTPTNNFMIISTSLIGTYRRLTAL